MPLCGERELSTPSYFAYLKLLRAATTAVPTALYHWQGVDSARTIENIVEEAVKLVENGAKEFILIAQGANKILNTFTVSSLYIN